MNNVTTEVLDGADPPLNQSQKQDQFALASITFKKDCDAIVIQSNEDYARGAQLMVDAAQKIKDVGAFMDEDIKRANDAHKSMTKKKRSIVEPLDEAKKKLGRLLGAYDDKIKQEKKDDEERLAREEREKEAAAIEKEKARRGEEAKAYKDSGDEETANNIVNAPMPEPVFTKPLSTVVVPTAKNVSFTDRWEVEVLIPELVPEKYKTINEPLLKKQANDFKGDIKIPGCVIRKVKGSITRTG